MAGHKTCTQRHEVAQTDMSDKHAGLYHTCTHTNTQECDKRAGVFWLPKTAGFLFCFFAFWFSFALSHLTYRFCIFCGSSPSKKKETKHSGAFSRLQKKAHNFKNTLTQDLMIENYISLGSHKSTSRLRKGDLQITSAYLVSHSFSHIMLPEE